LAQWPLVGGILKEKKNKRINKKRKIRKEKNSNPVGQFSNSMSTTDRQTMV
jgi:hypothetical protein